MLNTGIYTGKEIDPVTGLYYFNARWYDPDLGRFITEDPVKDGNNWYVYCANNPLSFTDPTGLASEEFYQGLADGSIDGANLTDEDKKLLDMKSNEYSTGNGSGPLNSGGGGLTKEEIDAARLQAILDAFLKTFKGTVDGLDMMFDFFHFDTDTMSGGWTSSSFQKWLGYGDVYDDMMFLLFDIDATKFNLPNDIDLRLWKGDYDTLGGIQVGGGGEIGFYMNDKCMTPEQLKDNLGLTGTTLEVYEKGTDRYVTGRVENRPTYWNTAFKPSDNPGKENLYTKTTYSFKDKGSAEAFRNNIRDNRDEARAYDHNRNQQITTSKVSRNNTVTITWGRY